MIWLQGMALQEPYGMNKLKKLDTAKKSGCQFSARHATRARRHFTSKPPDKESFFGKSSRLFKTKYIFNR
jgi:hypothetical protein